MSQAQIRIIKASNLPILDIISGKVDPYASVTTGHEYHWHNKNARTKVRSRDRNPIWEETFIFPVEDPRKDMIQITVWDQTAFGANMIGQASFPLQNLPKDVEQFAQVPLMKAGHQKGILDIGVRVNFGIAPVISQTTTTTTFEPAYNASFIQPPPMYTQPPQAYGQPQMYGQPSPMVPMYYSPQPIATGQPVQPGYMYPVAEGQPVLQSPQPIYQPFAPPQ